MARRTKKAFAVLHCTMSGSLIALTALTAALVVAGDQAWPAGRWAQVVVLTLAIGVAYTIYSEHLNAKEPLNKPVVIVTRAWNARQSITGDPWASTGLVGSAIGGTSLAFMSPAAQARDTLHLLAAQ
jgi:hypothetical protein